MMPWWVYLIVPGAACAWVLLEMYLQKTRAKNLEEEDHGCGCGGY